MPEVKDYDTFALAPENHIFPMSAKLPKSPQPRRPVLIAVIGSTPAVLTETVWALARPPNPIIPDLVVVITTQPGAAGLRDQILTPRSSWGGVSIWQALRKSVLGKDWKQDVRLQLAAPSIISVPDPITGIARPLDDIRTPEENAATAECILSVVRNYTTDPDCQVLGLLAGGRKSMGALLHASLTLVGRSGDRLMHVLVNEPFDHPGLKPTFYYPGQPGPAKHRLPDGGFVPHKTARIDLADVPMVALGELVLQATGHSPVTFSALMRAAETAVNDAKISTAPIDLGYDDSSGMLSINLQRIRLPKGRCAALTGFLWRRALADAEHLRNSDLGEEINRSKVTFDYNGVQQHFAGSEDVNKALNDLRKAVRDNAGEGIADKLLPLRSPVGFNRNGVKLIG